MTPEELKNRSLRVTHQVEAIPSDDKDLMELDILQASKNLEKYQQETMSHPEIFEFQDVIKIKNKTTTFS